jgi:hypothetical protein
VVDGLFPRDKIPILGAFHQDQHFYFLNCLLMLLVCEWTFARLEGYIPEAPPSRIPEVCLRIQIRRIPMGVILQIQTIPRQIQMAVTSRGLQLLTQLLHFKLTSASILETSEVIDY